MEKIAKTSKSLQFGVVSFLMLMVFSAFYAIKTSYQAEAKAETATTKVDTFKTKVDYRFTSYDNLFFHTNSVVIDSLGNKIGEVYILTNDDEINRFYDDTIRKRTKYYFNLINRNVKMKTKADVSSE